MPKKLLTYILAIERGENGRRIHGHVLIWNSGAIQPERLGEAWREICGGRLKRGEPLIELYNPGARGVAYALKTFQTEQDLVFFSRPFNRAITGLE